MKYCSKDIFLMNRYKYIYKGEPGGRNNKLWLSMKILLRDSKFDFSSEEFRKFRRDVQQRQKDEFPLNIPGPQYTFNPSVVNNYCIDNLIPPLYPLWENRNKKVDMKLNNFTFNNYKLLVVDEVKVSEDTTIFEDMRTFYETLVPGQLNNRDKMAGFIQALIQKYGEEKTRYFYDTLFEKYFCWQ